MSFGQPSSIEGIEGLRPSIYNSPKDSNWINKDIIWSAIGYNRKIAPIQMLTFYNAIANNGKMVKPTLVPGTAEVINEHMTSQVNEYYEGDNTVSEYHLAFCGYFPADKPKYSMIVSLNKLGLPASGGGMAGDAFHNNS